MSEGFAITSLDQFTEQARLHSQIRDHFQQIVSSFDTHYNEIVSTLTDSQITAYTQWWQTRRKELLAHADFHDQFAHHLATAKTSYETTDQIVAHTIQATVNQSAKQ